MRFELNCAQMTPYFKYRWFGTFRLPVCELWSTYIMWEAIYRCSYCGKHHKSLSAMVSHAYHASQADDHTNPSNYTNYLYLTREEKDECLRCMHHETTMCKQQIRRLQEAISLIQLLQMGRRAA